MTTHHADHRLSVALAFFAGAVVADLLLIGGELFAYGMHWREQWRR